ncbi:hypothetical protein EV1_023664 [Malus domestica]
MMSPLKDSYEPFRNFLYIEVKEISKMTPGDVGAYRKQLGLKIHGKDVTKPIKIWHHAGLTNKIFEMIKRLGYEKPMPIQALALPIIMSGRDCIGIAKTGSGKTLVYVLPMLRHSKDHPPVIHSVINKFARALSLRCVPVYGGSGIALQTGEWKVTHKETLGPISELTGAAITIRGQYFPPGKVPGPGDCKVFLFIDGLTEQSVKRGKAEIKRKSEEIMNQALPLPGGAQQRRYQAV